MNVATLVVDCPFGDANFEVPLTIVSSFVRPAESRSSLVRSWYIDMQYSPVVTLPKEDRMDINIAVRGTPLILGKARMPADALE